MKLSEELKWRGLVSNSLNGTFEQLDSNPTTFYVGTDPTGKSLHVGHLLAFIVAKLLQKHGHKPIILVGGATASLGDPSFKAEERKLLSIEEINENAERIKNQIKNIIDFNDEPNSAIMLNNYEWMHKFSFLDFAREVGKFITVNYMMAKESVKMRLEREGSGLSFTEFTYQLLQGYDFMHLYENYNCRMQIGGSDQWGNIMTGVELIRKKGLQDNVYSLVWPLVTRADGKKFGKSEGGKNIWLDPNLTSPYEFYQFWFNQSDSDAEKYIKMFTLLDKETIENIISEHQKAPHLRLLQKTLAKEVTILVHSEDEYNKAIEASSVLFKESTFEKLNSIDSKTLLSAFNGLPVFEMKQNDIQTNIKISDLAIKFNIFKSKGEVKRAIQNNGLVINKEKIVDDIEINKIKLIQDKFIIIQKGKKNYNLIKVIS